MVDKTSAVSGQKSKQNRHRVDVYYFAEPVKDPVRINPRGRYGRAVSIKDPEAQVALKLLRKHAGINLIENPVSEKMSTSIALVDENLRFEGLDEIKQYLKLTLEEIEKLKIDALREKLRCPQFEAAHVRTQRRIDH